MLRVIGLRCLLFGWFWNLGAAYRLKLDCWLGGFRVVLIGSYFVYLYLFRLVVFLFMRLWLVMWFCILIDLLLLLFCGLLLLACLEFVLHCFVFVTSLFSVWVLTVSLDLSFILLLVLFWLLWWWCAGLGIGCDIFAWVCFWMFIVRFWLHCFRVSLLWLFGSSCFDCLLVWDCFLWWFVLFGVVIVCGYFLCLMYFIYCLYLVGISWFWVAWFLDLVCVACLSLGR